MKKQTKKTQASETPAPDPALQRLARLVGTWTIKGKPLGASKNSISGKTTFRWLEGNAKTSFFLQQDMKLDYEGQEIKSHELIGFDPKTKGFSSLVFSNMAPDPWPYEWGIDGDNITISIRKKPMSATFTGKFAPDGKSFSGGWRPNRGADKIVNAPYDLVATRTR